MQYNQQGYAPQMAAGLRAPQPQQQFSQVSQEVRFYKSSFFFASAAGKTERDSRNMLAQGWKIKGSCFLGLDFFLRRIIMIVYEK